MSIYTKHFHNAFSMQIQVVNPTIQPCALNLVCFIIHYIVIMILILVPMINEAFFVLSEGLATPDDIDAGMRLGCNQPIGPLALADMIGLDVCLAVMEVYLSEYGDSKYRPCPLLKEMVAAGHLGRKTGRGVYHY